MSLQEEIEAKIAVTKENLQKGLYSRQIEHIAFLTCSTVLLTSEGPKILENNGISYKKFLPASLSILKLQFPSWAAHLPVKRQQQTAVARQKVS